MERFGVLLMTYGSPASIEDVGPYLRRVRGGRAPDAALVAEFQRRYRVIGSSPLVEITRNQAAALEDRLADGAVVGVGMRFSEPTIERALRLLGASRAESVAGIILSPQHSPLLMGGYERAVADAGEAIGPSAPQVRMAGAWYDQLDFVGAVATRIREALERFAPVEADVVPVLLTAHSIPRGIADQDPGYLAQLRKTAELVAAAAELSADRWNFCWQSAGHEPGEWMKPDLADLMPQLRAAGHRSVLVAPVQFLSDHLEILYDIDVAARRQAEAAGLRLERIQSLNTMPAFIDALAQVATQTLAPVSASGSVSHPYAAKPL